MFPWTNRISSCMRDQHISKAFTNPVLEDFCEMVKKVTWFHKRSIDGQWCKIFCCMIIRVEGSQSGTFANFPDSAHKLCFVEVRWIPVTDIDMVTGE